MQRPIFFHSVPGGQFIFFQILAVHIGKGGVVGTDLVEVFMNIQTVMGHFQNAACDVGAVVGDPLHICNKIRPEKTGFGRAFTAFEPQNVAAAKLGFQGIYDLFQRLDMDSGFQISGSECG